MNFEERKKKNRIQGYDLSHEEVAEFYDNIDFWKSAAEKSYVEGKYVHMAKPSNKAKARSVDIRCKVSKEEFLEMYEQHKRLIKTKRPESDGRLCRYCYNRFTFMTGFKRTNVSIDRLDSDKGYEKGNIVFSCGECNDRKNQISIDMCKRVVEVANEME